MRALRGGAAHPATPGRKGRMRSEMLTTLLTAQRFLVSWSPVREAKSQSQGLQPGQSPQCCQYGWTFITYLVAAGKPPFGCTWHQPVLNRQELGELLHHPPHQSAIDANCDNRRDETKTMITRLVRYLYTRFTLECMCLGPYPVLAKKSHHGKRLCQGVNGCDVGGTTTQENQYSILGVGRRCCMREMQDLHGALASESAFLRISTRDTDKHTVIATLASRMPRFMCRPALGNDCPLNRDSLLECLRQPEFSVSFGPGLGLTTLFSSPRANVAERTTREIETAMVHEEIHVDANCEVQRERIRDNDS